MEGNNGSYRKTAWGQYAGVSLCRSSVFYVQSCFHLVQSQVSIRPPPFNRWPYWYDFLSLDWNNTISFWREWEIDFWDHAWVVEYFLAGKSFLQVKSFLEVSNEKHQFQVALMEAYPPWLPLGPSRFWTLVLRLSQLWWSDPLPMGCPSPLASCLHDCSLICSPVHL